MTQKLDIGSFSAGEVGKQINIGLLGFKMAVNDSLTVFNLVDGVVDEFHDESGTDEGEGSNDNYDSSNDLYINSSTPDGSPQTFSAGFSMSSVTEEDTSEAVSHPTHGATPQLEFGTFTVPTGMTSANIQVWGAGGNGQGTGPLGRDYRNGGGGGYAEGTLAVTASQTLKVIAGEGGGIGPGGCGGGGAGGGDGGQHDPDPGGVGGGGGGVAGVFATGVEAFPQLDSAPEAYVIAGSGGGAADLPQSGGFYQKGNPIGCGNIGKLGCSGGGGGGGLIGFTHDPESSSPAFTVRHVAQTSTGGILQGPGGGGSQTAGGQGAPDGEGSNTGGDGQSGALFQGGNAANGCAPEPYTQKGGGGGGGYYGGGGGSSGYRQGGGQGNAGGGGGGSSFYGHPQITSGSTCAAGDPESSGESGGVSKCGYSPQTGEGGGANPEYSAPPGSGAGGAPSPNTGRGEDGYVLITGTAASSAVSTTIISNAFTASSAPSTSRIVVFQENIDTPTLNTDLIASVSRDGGTTFTTITLADEGYITGSSGQRILAGVATISGQPSGTSMRWKLALANNQSKIHGVSLSWA
jgi:hypothetical protein